MPRRGAEPPDPVQLVADTIDIASLAIRYGAQGPEKILKLMFKAVVEKVKAYWNANLDTTRSPELDVDVLSLLNERWVPSQNITEFINQYTQYFPNMPDCTAHSNQHRPDGVFQFVCNGEVAHLFLEIDHDSKLAQRAHEAYKIWSDISASVAGEASTTAAGQSKAACVLRINIKDMNCTRLQYYNAMGESVSRKSTVPLSRDFEDNEEMKAMHAELNLKHIDDVKQIYIMFHKAIVKQSIRALLVWLQHTFEQSPSKLKETNLAPKLLKNKRAGQRYDWCFWLGEYQLLSPHLRYINTKNPPAHDAVLDNASRSIPHNEIDKAKKAWREVFDVSKFKSNATCYADFDRFDPELYPPSRPRPFQPDEEAFQRFYVPSKTYSLTDVNKSKKDDKTWNSMRSQGHLVLQIGLMKRIMYEKQNGADRDTLNTMIEDWIKESQTPFMPVTAEVDTNRGRFNEITKVQYTGVDKTKCEFTIMAGLFVVCVPRADITELAVQVEEFLKRSNQPLAQRRPSLQDLLQNALSATLAALPPAAPPEPPAPNLQEKMDFEQAQETLYNATVGKVKGMLYSSHLQEICTRILNVGSAQEREHNALKLFAAQLKVVRVQINGSWEWKPVSKLPLQQLFPGNAQGFDWHTSHLQQNQRILVPLLWDPLSSMLVNAFLFFIRGIRQGSAGYVLQQTNRSGVRQTVHIYKMIQDLLQNDSILPDLLAHNHRDVISQHDQNLNTKLLDHVVKDAFRDIPREFQTYLDDKFRSQYCLAFCNLIKCSDPAMLHWTAKMYRQEQFKTQIDKQINLFPLAGQAVILRMLYEAAEQNPIVFKSNMKLKTERSEVNNNVDPGDDLGPEPFFGDGPGDDALPPAPPQPPQHNAVPPAANFTFPFDDLRTAFFKAKQSRWLLCFVAMPIRDKNGRPIPAHRYKTDKKDGNHGWYYFDLTEFQWPTELRDHNKVSLQFEKRYRDNSSNRELMLSKTNTTSWLRVTLSSTPCNYSENMLAMNVVNNADWNRFWQRSLINPGIHQWSQKSPSNTHRYYWFFADRLSNQMQIATILPDCRLFRTAAQPANNHVSCCFGCLYFLYKEKVRQLDAAQQAGFDVALQDDDPNKDEFERQLELLQQYNLVTTKNDMEQFIQDITNLGADPLLEQPFRENFAAWVHETINLNDDNRKTERLQEYMQCLTAHAKDALVKQDVAPEDFEDRDPEFEDLLQEFLHHFPHAANLTDQQVLQNMQNRLLHNHRGQIIFVRWFCITFNINISILLQYWDFAKVVRNYMGPQLTKHVVDPNSPEYFLLFCGSRDLYKVLHPPA